MKLSHLRIGTRLWLAVALFVGALLLLITFAAVRSVQSQAAAEVLLSQAETKVKLATRWAGLTETAVGRVQILALSNEPALAQTLKPLNDQAVAEITELQKQLKTFDRSPDEGRQLELIAQRRQAVLDSAGRMTKHKEGGDAAAALRESNEVMSPATKAYLDALRDYVKLQEAGSALTRQQVAADRRSTVVTAAVVVALIVAGALAGTGALVRSIRQPLRDAVALADAIAAGDLSERRVEARGDEFGDLMRAQVSMLDALRRTVSEVHHASDGIRTASAEIAAGNHDLSSRTEQAAGSLQQTASSISQLTGTVRQSADSAQQANQLASSAADVASRGGEVVAQVVATMDEINASSRKISDIIGTIDGIAFQTNILALNAAVEAARAGEQGRGFAVVASEVRSLAGRSADAAREIKALIGSSVERVEAGSRLVGDAGSTMQEIVASVNRVRDIIGEISAASSEQSQGIGQVNSAVTQLDHMTQQNAALVEQSAAAATSLQDQAQRLNQVVEVFRLEARGVA